MIDPYHLTFPPPARRAAQSLLIGGKARLLFERELRRTHMRQRVPAINSDLMAVQDDIAAFLAIVATTKMGAPVEEVPAGTAALSKFIFNRFGTPWLPGEAETVAVAAAAPKAAALCFDRVWTLPMIEDGPPEPIRAYGATDVEIWLQVLVTGAREQMWDWSDVPQLARDANVEVWFESAELSVERFIAETLQRSCSIAAVPVFDSATACRAQYAPGSSDVVVAILDALEVVDEDKLSWPQVLEFRRDKEARSKYRRFIHWLDAEMVGRDTTYIADDIANRLDGYRWALRKHGITTLISCLSSLLDPRFAMAVSSASLAMALSVDKLSALATAVTAAIGQVTVTLAKGAIDLNDARRGAGSEIAFIHEVHGKK